MSDELPGLSVFYKDENGDIFHTYSTYARGLDMLVGAYTFLDLVPKGRRATTSTHRNSAIMDPSARASSRDALSIESTRIKAPSPPCKP